MYSHLEEVNTNLLQAQLLHILLRKPVLINMDFQKYFPNYP